MIYDRIVRRSDGLFEICEVEIDDAGKVVNMAPVNLAFDSVIAISDRIGKMREAFESPAVFDGGAVHVITFTEGCFADHVTFPTKGEARGFCKGFSCGADHYGAGSAMAFIVPDDEEQMREYASDEYNPFEDGEIDKAIRAVKGT